MFWAMRQNQYYWKSIKIFQQKLVRRTWYKELLFNCQSYKAVVWLTTAWWGLRGSVPKRQTRKKHCNWYHLWLKTQPLYSINVVPTAECCTTASTRDDGIAVVWSCRWVYCLGNDYIVACLYKWLLTCRWPAKTLQGCIHSQCGVCCSVLSCEVQRLCSRQSLALSQPWQMLSISHTYARTVLSFIAFHSCLISCHTVSRTDQ